MGEERIGADAISCNDTLWGAIPFDWAAMESAKVAELLLAEARVVSS